MLLSSQGSLLVVSNSVCLARAGCFHEAKDWKYCLCIMVLFSIAESLVRSQSRFTHATKRRIRIEIEP